MRSSNRESVALRDLIALRMLPGVGDVGLHRVRQSGEPLISLWESRPVAEQQTALADADRAVQRMRALGGSVLCSTDDEYPQRLLDLHDPPAVLYTQGALATACAPAVAIVGTRRATSYGLRVARRIATACARAGVSVISGLAQGIDGAAHEAALAAGGRTVAVLGTGLDVAYPRRHHALQQQIGVDGLLLTELPPSDTGHAGTFPRRNRLIAALADLTVIVEAGVGSGALITAEYAHKMDRRIACVPNAIDIPTAAGSNALLKAYAEPILGPDDVLEMLSLQAEPTAGPVLDGDAAACWDALGHGADTLEAVARLAQLPMRATVSALSMLEIEGLVHLEAGGRVCATIAHHPRAVPAMAT